MRYLVLFVGICAFAKGQLLYELAEKKLKSQFQVRNRNDMVCDIDELDLVNELTQCEEIDGNLVPHGARCMTYSSTLDLSSVARCLDGQWITGQTSSVNHHRHKRFLGTLLKIVTTGLKIADVLCKFFCGSDSETVTVPVVRKAPSYGTTCPPADIQSVYFASEGTREAVVTWTSPVAKDEDGTKKSDEQTSRPLKGERFQGSVYGLSHTVTYMAKDNDGLFGYCTFHFTVTVRTCKEMARISHGYKECSEGNIYGSVCSFHCDEGYKRSGDSKVKCREDGSWSGGASCSKKQCDKPEEPLNGAVTCLNLQYEYLSICFVRCNKGFTLEGSVVMQCQADQTWAMAGIPRCVDVEPPKIECLTPQVKYADKGKMLTASSVVWEEPWFYDTVDENPALVQTGGPQQHATLTEESTFVTYFAIDEAGNKSPECSIELRVEPISCGHPADTLTDTKLVFNCSSSLYYYGTTCDLSCDLNFPLDGPDQVICEATSDDDPIGQWDWGSGAKPNCREVQCPALNPPRNGVIKEDYFNGRPVAIMQCNEQFDISAGIDGFNGKLQCYDTGNWLPLPALPDCVEPRSKYFMSLPSELFYYTGECSDPATQEHIKQQFSSMITEETESKFHSLCSKHSLNCSIDSVKITCGPTSRRKRDLQSDINHNHEKRTDTYLMSRKTYSSNVLHHVEKRADTHVMIVEFNIVIAWNQDNLNDLTNMTMTQALGFIEDLQIDQKAVIAEIVAGGKLDFECCTLKDDSFQTAQFGNLMCAHGTIRSGIKCKPCPRGRYFDENKKCTECPVGYYRDTDKSLACDKCPEGTTTEKNGSVSSDNCTEICSPGSCSKKGLAPCSLCPEGTYQGSYGMSVCDQCPSGKTTATKGSTTQAACQGFDALLRTTSQEVSIGFLPEVENLSLLFWAKLFSVGTTSMASLKLKDESDVVLMTINIAPEISVKVGESLLETAVILSDTKWFHVGVVWNYDMSSVRVFIDGEYKNDQAVSSTSLNNGSVAVHSNALEGVYLSGLVVVDRVLKEEDIKPLLTSCTETLDNTILTMDSLLGKTSNGIKIITPAICDAIDECSDSPCGNHLCVNEIGNFSCICSQGMTGRFCDIPVDYCNGNGCKHGATCNNQDNGYTCSCLEGYSGSLCEIAPVNGNWSEYSEWSSCSVSCEQGKRTRSRTCDNPPPGLGGKSCNGPDLETEDCNLGPCKECSDAPPRCFGIFPNCSTDSTSGIRQCFPYCRDGTFIQPGKDKYENYTCGPNTDYEWTPFNWCPKCMDNDYVDRPDRYQLDTSMEYETPVPSSSATDVKSKIENELTSRTDCASKGLCQVAISLDDVGSRKKRGTGSLLQITFDVVPGNNGNLKIDEYADSGTVSAGLQELVDAIVSLELTAADLLANASSYFNVDSGGVTYTINNNSLTIDGIIDCPAGSVSDDGVCVACPVGTKVDSNACVYCDVGSYQDETGQTDCKQCPSGSTPIIGASDVSECTGFVSETSTQMTTTNTTAPGSQPDDSGDEDDDHVTQNKTGIIAGIAIGSFAAFLAAIAIVLVCYYKYARNNRRQNQIGSFASLNMVGPINDGSRPNNNLRFTGHIGITTDDPLPPVSRARSGVDALMKKKELRDIDDLTTRFTATPPPPYSENP